MDIITLKSNMMYYIPSYRACQRLLIWMQETKRLAYVHLGLDWRGERELAEVVLVGLQSKSLW